MMPALRGAGAAFFRLRYRPQDRARRVAAAALWALLVSLRDGAHAGGQPLGARGLGHVVGGGVVIAAACDCRIAAVGTQFMIPEVRLGVPLAFPLFAPFF